MNQGTDYTVCDSVTGQVLFSGTCEEPDSLTRDGWLVVSGEKAEETHYRLNNEWAQIPPQPTPNCTWHWDTHSWGDVRTLQEVKDKKWTEIKAKRNELEQAGFPYLGSVFDSDATSVQRITVAVAAAQKGIEQESTATVIWTLADNTTKVLTLEQVVYMPVALFTYAGGLHNKSQLRRQQIDMCTTIEEVESITWD